MHYFADFLKQKRTDFLINAPYFSAVYHYFGETPFFLPGIFIFFSSAFDFSCVSFSSALTIKVKCRLEFRKNYYEKIHKPKFDSKSSKRIMVKREVGFIRKEFLVLTIFFESQIFLKSEI